MLAYRKPAASTLAVAVIAVKGLQSLGNCRLVVADTWVIVITGGRMAVAAGMAAVTDTIDIAADCRGPAVRRCSKASQTDPSSKAFPRNQSP